MPWKKQKLITEGVLSARELLLSILEENLMEGGAPLGPACPV